MRARKAALIGSCSHLAPAPFHHGNKYGLVAGLLLAFAPGAAWANCTQTGNVITCTPTPTQTARVGSGPNSANNLTVDVQAGAQVNVQNAAAISLRDNSTINLADGASVTNNITVQPGQPNYDSVINGLYATNQWNGAGPNTIEFHTGNTLNVGVGATISGNGDANSRAEAINIIGFNNTIINRGTITSVNRPAIWFQDEQRAGVAGTTNTIDNYGTISTGAGSSAPVIGNNANGSVIFTNRTGARVVGSLQFAGGNDQLTLEAGSVITGSFDGGGGTNSLTLSGVVGSADTLGGDIRNFQTLTKTGEGRWTLTGAVGANGGNAPLQMFVNQGTLALTGNNANFNGSVLVAAAGTLEGRAQSLPPTIADNGLVRFTQDTAGTYSGLISGTGAVEKALGGDLTLAGANSYSGGTTILSGTAFISTDTNLGAASGGLAMNGGYLGSVANVATARATTLGPLGGGFNTAAGTTLTHNGTISGTGMLTKIGAGTAVLTGTNTYLGGTSLDAGVLEISSDANLGAAPTTLTFDGGTLRATATMATTRATTIDAGGGTIETVDGVTLAYGSNIAGTGLLTKTGAGTLVLAGTNSQGGGTAINGGVVQITSDANLGATGATLSFDSGTLLTNNDLTIARSAVLGSGGGTLDTEAGTLTYTGIISGAGGLTATGAGGNTVLTGANTYTGTTTVAAGYLIVNGDQSAATGLTTVASGGRLSGDGIIGGDVTVADGGVIGAGSVPLTPGHLTINGSLTLNPNSVTFFNVANTDVGGALNDLIDVQGNLTLDGTINVFDSGQNLGPGVYRVFNYAGTLTDNGLTIGSFTSDPTTPTRPLTGFTVQTAVAGQVNLINSSGLSLNYWDGTDGPKNNNVINGGTGIWRHSGPSATSNWTDPLGAVNAPWEDNQFAIFLATPGTVDVVLDNGAVTTSGMQFGVNGYLVQGAALSLVGSPDAPGDSVIRVGDGTTAGAGMTATINSALTGSTLLRKTDGGTLVLNGVNSYAGGTIIEGGTIEITADTALGAAGSQLRFEGGTLRTAVDMVETRPTVMGVLGGTFETATAAGAPTTLEYAAGIGGTGALTKTGSGTLLLTADSLYRGGTTISAGTMQFGNGGTTGGALGPIVDNARLVVNRSNMFTFNAAITGTGSLEQAGTGTTVMQADNSYAGGTTISAGTLQLGSGGTAGSVVGPILDNATLAINRSNDFTLDSPISGTGALVHAGTGRTILTGTNSYTGGTTVSSGRLYVDGNQSGATGAAVAMSGTRLGGSGILGGDATIQDGATLSPGSDSLVPGILTVNGNLALNPNSTLLYNITSTVVGGTGNDLTVVGGNLTLDGTINVVDQGQNLGPGVYRVFNYGGALIDNGLTIGGYTSDGTTITRPLTDFIVQTVIPNQVNLINVSGGNLNYWDGTAIENKNDNIIEGGDGIWFRAGPLSTNNWTDPAGTVNAPWADGQFAIFLGAPGTVTASNDDGDIQTAGMQFGVNGYLLQAEPDTSITLVSSPDAPGEATIRVGDGTAAGAAMTATISAPLTGDVLVRKTDAGTLILSGTNTYTGGTRIEGGVIQIGADTALGSPTSRLTFDGGTLRMTASLDKTRPITMGPNGGTFDTVSGTSTLIESAIDGTGALTKIGDGTLTFVADNSYTGTTTIGAGVLQLGNGGTTGSLAGAVVDNASLVVNRSNSLLISGAISGTGSVTQAGTGTTILSADNLYTGGTTISAGTLQIGNGGTTGHVIGDIVDNGTLIINRSDTKLTPGVISGTGQLIQAGAGITVLQADNSYTGGTTISAGTLQLGDGGTAGSVVGDILDNSVLAFNRSDEVTYAGVISGTGMLVQRGPGKTILTGANTITGGSTVEQGTLQIGNGGTTGQIFGDILNNGTVILDRADDILYAGSISGTGNTIKNGAGTLFVTGTGTYTGGTTINAGVLQLGTGGTSGSILGDIVDNAKLTVNRSDSLLLTGVISGTGAFEQAGTGTTVFEANNSYTGGTLISAGTLQIGNGGETGLVPGNVVNNGRLVINRSNTKLLEGVVSGTGEVIQAGLGTLIVNNANSYSGGTTIQSGILQISSDANLGAASGGLRISGGTLRTTADIASARTVTLTDRIGTIETVDGTTLRLDGLVSGAGGLTKTGAGRLILTGANSYAGETVISAGTLWVYGDQTATVGLTTAQSGAALGGIGTIGGDVVIADGAILAPGDTPGTLTINGNLTLNAGSILNYEFGQANVAGGPLNDLTAVGGNLVLDGTLNVTVSAGGTFGPGVYRVFDYAGALTDNGLAIGTIPDGSYFVQTSVPNQVNLINTTGLTLSYWDGVAGPKNDGVVNGGDGVWQNFAGNDNWTDSTGTPNAPFTDGAFAVFQGVPGAVTVDASLGPINVSGMQFAVDGYAVSGDPINLLGPSAIVRVGDGTAAGAAMSATVNPVLAGDALLSKTDLGTLILTGANSYTGGTAIDGGVLQVASDANLGAATGGLSFDGGTLRATADISTARATTLNAGGGTIETAGLFTLAGAAGGAGGLTKTGAGTLILAADNSYTGVTTISAGTLQIGAGGTMGSVAGDIVDNAALVIDRASDLTLAGVISGTGTLTHQGSGVTTLTGANSYAGATSVTAGTLLVYGDQSAALGPTSVALGATLGGIGTIGGGVSVGDGTLAPGPVTGVPGTLTIAQDLTLAAGSHLAYNFGQANVVGGPLNDLTVVGGNLALDGVIDVTLAPGGTIDAGIYRVINYAGALTNNGLQIGMIPSPGFLVQTSVPSQVNLVNTAGLTLNFWDGDAGPKNDGVVNGGNGLWQNASGNDNWTSVDGTPNAPFTDAAFAVFQGAPGAVAVDDSLGAINVSGMQFAIGGYGVSGDPINLVGTSATVRVGDGTADGAAMTATIDSALAGTATLVKADLGTLILNGANSYAGGTAITGGVLQVGSDANLGAAAGALSLDGGTLRNTAAFTAARVTTLGALGGIFETLADLTLSGAIGGAGALTKTGAAALILTGDATHSGGTTISAGTLQIGDGGTSGSIAGDILDNGALVIDRSDSVTLAGAISGTGSFEQAGTGTTILTGDATHSGGTTISAGTLQIGDGGTSGSIAGEIVDNGTLAFNRSDTLTYAGLVSGTGTLVQAGPGRTILTASNSYSGGTSVTAGTLQVASDANLGAPTGPLTLDGGTLATTADFATLRATAIGAAGGAIDTLAGTTFTHNGVISGTGAFTKAGAGTLTLTGANSYTGPATIAAGTLLVDGNQSAATGLLTAASGATLGGTGVIGGDVTIADGGILAPGDSPGTLTINGSLTLSSGSVLAYEFGQANAVGGALNDLTVVGGNLVLDGTINVAVPTGGAFDPGVYRVFNYAGTLTDNGLALGTIPSSDVYVQTSIANQVNLVNTAGLTLNYWDGAAGPKNDGVVNGGDGVWQNAAGNDNWTIDVGTPNAPFTDAAFAIFQGTAGTVTVDQSLGPINVSGMQFATNGYVVQGDPINLVGTSATVRVGDGTPAGAGMTATIGSVLAGGATLAKTDLGTLILTGANSYAGGTAINGGVLQVASDANLGAASGGVSFSGGTLRTTADLTSARAVTLAATGTFEPVAGTALTLTGLVSGAGALAKGGDGTLILAADASYAGGTTINTGTLQLGNGGTAGSVTGDIVDNGILAINRSDTLELAGIVSGTGALQQIGTGTTVLTGANSYTGGTTISAGTLQIGNGGTTGSIVGDITDNAALVFNRSDTITYAGAVSGTGTLTQAGAGTLILTGTNSYAGGTTLNAGTLQIAADVNLGAPTGPLTLAGGTLATTADLTTARMTALEAAGGTFDTAAGTTLTHTGVISGPGGFAKAGTGALTLTGASSYAGPTTVNAGTLYVDGDSSAATGPVTVAAGAVLSGIGTIGGGVTIGDGGALAPGHEIGTLAINGPLSLGAGSILNYDLGEANVVGGELNDLTTVGGDLVLDGTINVTVTPGGTWDPGVYRIISYGGALTDSGLTVGAIPAPDHFVQTSIAGQVNLVNTTGLTLSFWDGDAGPKNDGVVNGGNGTWLAAPGNDNWTTASGTPNAPFTDASFAVFQGTAGTVTADLSAGAINVSGMQFATNGYQVQGAAINLIGGTSIVRVGDGTTAGTGMTATIASVLTGGSTLVKSDLGTLVLTGANSYAGGTAIEGGVLQVAGNANLGAAAGGLSLDGGTLRTTASFDLARATVLEAGGGTFDVQSGTTLTLPSALTGAGGLTKTGTGSLILQAANAYAGPTGVAQGVLAVGDAAHPEATASGPVAVAADATLAGYGSVNGGVANAGTIAVADALPAFSGGGTGILSISGALANAGLVQLGGPGVGNRLIAGSYVGQGGTIAINTVLGGDDSPSDQLVINGGTASGNSTLVVTNLGGLGAETPGNGIAVVVAQNGAITGTGAFTLGGRVVAGPYQYDLFRGSRDASSPESWYLRTEASPPTPVEPPVPPTVPPLYRPEVPTYTATPAMALMFGRDLIGTLHDRVGEQEQLIGRTGEGDRPLSGVWGRVLGGRTDWDAAPGGVYNEGPAFRHSNYAMQVGVDLIRGAGTDGSLNAAGVILSYGWDDGIVKDYDLSYAGKTRFDAYSAGVYGTHYGAGGWYVDSVAMVTRYNVKAGSGFFADMKTRGTGFAASIEAGMPFKLGGGLSIQPQAQLVAQTIDFRDSSDAAADVRFDDATSLAGRLGVRVVSSGERPGSYGPRPFTIWVRANVWHEFMADPKTSFSSENGFVPFRSDIKGTWAEFSGGVSAELTQNATIYMSTGLESDFGDKLKSWDVKAGLRFHW